MRCLNKCWQHPRAANNAGILNEMGGENLNFCLELWMRVPCKYQVVYIDKMHLAQNDRFYYE